MDLRTAQLGDAAAIARLHIASWRAAYTAALPAEYLAALDEGERAEQWRVRLNGAGTAVLLAERERTLLGFCAHGPALDESLTSTWEIYSLHVQPELRSRGIGSLLFSEAQACARRAVASALVLWVVANNTAARRFYEGKGMQADGAAKTRELAPGVVLHEVHYRQTLQ